MGDSGRERDEYMVKLQPRRSIVTVGIDHGTAGGVYDGVQTLFV